MLKLFDEEARAGFPRMRGTRLRGVIPVTQELLNSLLSSLRFHMELQAHNRVLISYRGVRLAANLIGISPNLMIILSTSWLSRAAIRAVLFWKPGWKVFLNQQDRFVYVLCADIPAVARYRYLWQYVSKVDAQTAPGLLILNTEIDIP